MSKALLAIALLGMFALACAEVRDAAFFVHCVLELVGLSVKAHCTGKSQLKTVFCIAVPPPLLRCLFVPSTIRSTRCVGT